MLKIFTNEHKAIDQMETINKNRLRNNVDSDIVVIIKNPENNYCLMNLKEASENGFLYKWSV